MDKALKYFVVLLTILIFSCNHEKKSFSSTNNIDIRFNPWFTFDYNSRVLRLKFDGEKVIQDTLHFSEGELKLIENSYFENDIGAIEGEIRLGHFIEFPSSAYIIEILQNNKKHSSIHWESDYRKGNGIREQGYVGFCITLMDMIKSKKEFSKMTEISLEKQAKYFEDNYKRKQTP
jgi:hypothetical protein